MRANDSMITPKIEDLLDRVDSKFSLVTLGARRARQINSYFNQLGDGLGNSIPPQVSSVARKPLSIAFEEIAVDKIVKTELPDDVYYDAVDGNSYLTDWAAAASADEAVDAESGEVASDDSAE
ncbi:MAG: DNA-directed polymerase omega subunit [Actinomycetota bacterium]|jgi:DNA-directed RNA polymerase subunit omega